MTTHDPITPQEELILDLVEGGLDPAREAAVLAALDAPARARVETMRRHRSLLRRVGDVAPPAQLLDRALAVLEREAVAGPSVRPGDTYRIDEYRARAARAWPGRLAIAAGLALLVGGVGYWAFRIPSLMPAPHGGVTPNQLAEGSQKSGHTPDTSTPTTPARPTPAIAAARPSEHNDIVQQPEPAPVVIADLPSSPVTFEDTDEAAAINLAIADAIPAGYTSADAWSAHETAPATMSVFSSMPASLDLERAARLAEEGRLVIRVRADRPALAAVRLLGQTDPRANKGRTWRLLPCPPSDYEQAAEAALPQHNADDPSGYSVPYRAPIRPVVETVLSVELDPAASSLAMVQAELEIIAGGAVIFDMLEQPVTMAPPCADEGGLRGWSAAPTSVVHTVVVPVVVESND